MIRGSEHQEDVMILMCIHQTTEPQKYMKQKSIQKKDRQIRNNDFIFNIPFQQALELIENQQEHRRSEQHNYQQKIDIYRTHYLVRAK